MAEATVRDNCSAAVKLLNWNHRLLSALGVQPRARSDVRYFLVFSYYATVIIFEYVDLFQNMDDLKYVVWSLQETICFTQIIIKLATLRYYNQKFGKILSAATIDFNGYSYMSPEERNAFTIYINMSRFFMTVLMISVALVAPIYYLKPLLIKFNVDSVNATTTYKLPYFVYLIYKVQSMESYMIAYIIELPIAIISAISNTATDVLMFTVVFYICGQLSVLAIRLRNLDKNRGYDIKTLVKHHARLLRIGNSIKEAFNFVLFGHLVGAGIFISLLSYLYLMYCLLVQCMQDFNTNQRTDLVFLIIYEFLIVFVLFSHCAVGQYLYSESLNVHYAFYNCKWYDMSREDKMIIKFCIARSQQPLCLTAGPFGIFSLEMLINVLKTSMAYLSLLRNFM